MQTDCLVKCDLLVGYPCIPRQDVPDGAALESMPGGVSAGVTGVNSFAA
jgi:hypothetical protein